MRLHPNGSPDSESERHGLSVYTCLVYQTEKDRIKSLLQQVCNYKTLL